MSSTNPLPSKISPYQAIQTPTPNSSEHLKQTQIALKLRDSGIFYSDAGYIVTNNHQSYLNIKDNLIDLSKLQKGIKKLESDRFKAKARALLTASVAGAIVGVTSLTDTPALRFIATTASLYYVIKSTLAWRSAFKAFEDPKKHLDNVCGVILTQVIYDPNTDIARYKNFKLVPADKHSEDRKNLVQQIAHGEQPEHSRNQKKELDLVKNMYKNIDLVKSSYITAQNRIKLDAPIYNSAA